MDAVKNQAWGETAVASFLLASGFLFSENTRDTSCNSEQPTLIGRGILPRASRSCGFPALRESQISP